MNEFVKILDEEDMFYYVNDSLSSNILESAMIVCTIAFIVWTVKLALEKE